ncbi:hypothetical protein ABIF68_011030 [Bradyrhizobium japonicum]|jgi:hypothetical protein|nr:hypothetical protein [Bradyrhizobium japonicum]MCP1965965.1 hypothetical protein [Bradyrhizobium japonicum]
MCRIDEHSPVFVRSDPNRPELFEVTYLSSDPLGVHRQTAVAFDPRIRSLGADLIARAAAGEPVANRAIGEYLLLTMRAGPGCLDSAPLDLSGFLPGYAERGALRFCRCVGRA